MKIYNKSTRTINPNTPSAVKPGWNDVSNELGAKLLKLFPRQFTTSDTADQPSPKEAELAKQNEAQAKQIEELTKRLSALEQLTKEAAPTPANPKKSR